MVLDPHITILKEEDIPEASIRLRSDGIVHVHYKKNSVLDVGLQLKMRKIFNEITGHRKSKFIFTAAEGFSMTREARENGPKLQEESNPIKYYAIVIDNLAYKIIVNFYLKVFKPKGNYKLFKSLEEGVEWLHTLE